MLAKNLSGLPPAIVITADNDPLRDDGEAYAERMSQDGVSVRTRRFDGVVHKFFSLAGVSLKGTQAVEEAADGLKFYFNS